MSDPNEDKTFKINVNVGPEVRARVSDFCTILQIKPKDLVTRALDAYMDALEKKHGEKISAALQALKTVRETEL